MSGVEPEEKGLARGRLAEAEQEAYRRGLAGAVGPEHRDDVAELDLEADAFQGFDSAVLLCGVDELSCRGHGPRLATYA